MSDETRSLVAHLLRRSGFAPRPAEVDAAASVGYAGTVESITTPGVPDAAAAATPPPAFATPRTAPGAPGSAARKAWERSLHRDGQALALWWLDRMTATERPSAERLTFFWHGHFATAISKVRLASYMLGQNEIFRRSGLGAFDALTLAVAQDPAMLIWLDASQDVAAHPNENFARELMELFTLGIGNYSETDVREAARAFTGWHLDRSTGTFEVRNRLHDNGPKTVLHQTASFDGAALIDLVTRGQQSARWVATRLWARHVAPVSQRDPAVDSVADQAQRAPGGAVVVADLLRRIWLSGTFTDPATRGQLVSQPVEYVVGVLRQLGLRAAQHPQVVSAALRDLGQVPFDPPSVGGWPAGHGWLTTSAALARTTFARAAVAASDMSAVSDEPVTGRVDAAAHLLSLDGWTPGTRSALQRVAGDPPSLLALALTSPEYVSR